MKILKRLLIIAVCIVTLVTLFYSWTNWWGARKLSAALAVLREKNEPTRFEEFVPTPVPDADNVAAAPVFQEVFVSEKDSRLRKLDLPWKKITGKPEPGESPIHFKARFLNPDFKGDDQAAGELVLKSLAPCAPLLEEVAQAVRRPGVCWPLDYSKGFAMPMPYLGAMIGTSRVFQERALAELASGHPGNAFQDVQTLLALARAARSSPVIMSLLLEKSILIQTFQVISDGLERHAWTDAQLAELSSELSLIDLLARISDCLRWDRTCGLQADLSISSRTNLVTLLELPYIGTGNVALRATWALRPAGWFNEDKAGYIGTIQRYIDAVKQPKQLPSTLADIEAARAGSSVWHKIRNPLSYLAIPALIRSAKSIAATQTLLRSLATACAVERYRMAHGRLPATLEDLVPAFLPSTPTDPLTGKPLCYKPSESSSYLIYGTGWDQTDNAGSSVSALNDYKKFADQPDWGVLVKF
jgi:hypothetical protein